MLNQIEAFYEKQNEATRECLLYLRQEILKLDPKLNEQWKYGAPFFCYENKMFCYFWIDKKLMQPYVSVAEGRRLDHPMLEQGDRKRMKIIRINPDEDLPISEIRLILNEALTFY